MSEAEDLKQLIAAYHAQAEECRRSAAKAGFEEVRNAYRDLEQHWEDLAREAEESRHNLAERLDAFMKKVG